MGVVACVRQAPLHFVEVCLFPIYFEPAVNIFERHVEKNQNVRLSDLLPHGWNAGMFLRDRNGVVPQPNQIILQRSFAGGARSNNADFHFTRLETARSAAAPGLDWCAARYE